MVSKDDVKHIAGLSRIFLTNEEIDPLAKDLEKILHYVEKLEKLDVSNITPTSHVFPLENVYREDEVKPSLGQKEALKIAIEQKDGSFKVPKVLE